MNKNEPYVVHCKNLNDFLSVSKSLGISYSEWENSGVLTIGCGDYNGEIKLIYNRDAVYSTRESIYQFCYNIDCSSCNEGCSKYKHYGSQMLFREEKLKRIVNE